MSRIGRKPITVPAGVKVTITGQSVTVAGPKHSQTVKVHDNVKVSWTESERSLKLSIDAGSAEDRFVRACWGTSRALIQNAIEGVTKGYEKSLEIIGVGWVPSLVGKKLKLVVGFANPLLVDIPAGLDVTVDKQFVKVKGPDKQMVGQFASAVRSLRKPEPYNGKGIKYTTETIRRKQGKQFGA
jgi:large subunit ribosomal protein L6